MEDKLRIHIRPGDWLADIDEVADGKEPRSRCRYFIAPYGPFELNEVGEANYYVGNKVPYHEHYTGYETFLVDGGALEILSRSRKAVARKGDIVHIMPYAPHSIRVLEDETIWRAFHQGHSLIPNMIETRRAEGMYPEIFCSPAYREEVRGRVRKGIWYDYLTPECIEVPASELPEIRTFDDAIVRFQLEGLELRLKVGRWETGGAKEVWQLMMKSGCSFRFAPYNIFPLLYDVYDGSLEVRLDGREPFVATTRDLLHIPKFWGGTITALTDTVLLDMGCQGYLTRYLDEVTVLKEREPAKLNDESFLTELMKKYDFYVQFKLK